MRSVVMGLAAGLLLCSCLGSNSPQSFGPMPSGVSTGTQQTVLPGIHIRPPATGHYNTDPPTSGEHYSIPGTAPAGWGFSSATLPPEVWLHNAEHGGVVILYANSTDATVVKNYIASAPPDLDFGEVKIVGTAYPVPGHPFALVAWGWLEFLDQWDGAAATAFYQAHVDRGPELIP